MTIRPWDVADISALEGLVGAYLTETYPAGYDYQPTFRNAATLVEVGLVHGAVGDPVLAAVDDDRSVIGWTAWFGATNPLAFDYRDRICFGMGTYVLPSARHQGVAAALHDAAVVIARNRGYTRVDRLAAGTGEGGRMLQRDGWEARGTWYVRAL